MRQYLFFLISIISIFISCRKDFETELSNGQLLFSKNTVYLDTVFSGVSSSTYSLKVYNKSHKDIRIPTVSLAKGTLSKYRLMIDGTTGMNNQGKIFNDVEILANDSLYIFIEETADIKDADVTDYLYTDQILFDTGLNQQKVDLVTLIQDAVFLYPEKKEKLTLDNLVPDNTVYGFELSEKDPINGNELHFTNKKPYVIYGYAGVPADKTLIIDPGARIYCHNQSGIFVKKSGSIKINGEESSDPKKLEKEVVFESDRLEPKYADIPGQWGGIYLADGSTKNEFNHLTIKNSSFGIFVDKNDGSTTNIFNTQIYNSSDFGLAARKGKIYGENIVINKCGQASLACTLGGEYRFKSCTFANYWNNSNRQTPCVYIDNTYKQKDVLLISDLSLASFVNCIIYGNNNIELGLKKNNLAAFNLDFSYCLIKFNDTNNQYNTSLYDFIKNTSNNNIVNTRQNNFDPKFKDPFKNDLRILKNSVAIAKGNDSFLIPKDIEGKNRTLPSDLGAYQHLNE
ncbi:hypothetical protein B0A78_07230 [Flavobacterium columnare NBRC 100251 = ATCC 23463]|uniref:Right handed beta helix domain-containing protein n=1 Tax=Flavobacterium columnare TaxID=996 RepID=A0AAI8CGB4_9FLAO|nr:hypothetical protein [Flavobacterium columnare]AMO19459.1 hypothetical protein UN65_03065 [Flavobacterium columnare]ANO49151.1 hypothetical protein Pf1_00903 [Flavobacterium columnare]APT22853.1 hypothetical protein BU993_09645 [Flavobacterium columnare]MEB3800203.1 hypothetical protein [Flavobacterium columnare]PDS24255.1 hypothetical protein B0A78_07230 [Flavobacterium columnare NBRC 100251 = ATCC 23463]